MSIQRIIYNILLLTLVFLGILTVYRWYYYFTPRTIHTQGTTATSTNLDQGILAGPVKRVDNPQDPAQKTIIFGAGLTPSPTPLAEKFQPTAPYHATFFYPWYGNMSIDKTWNHWDYQTHLPPTNWYSNYLPDTNPASFDPATELYSSHDQTTAYWQLRKLAEAKQEVGIASWWGRNHPTDVNMKWMISDVMNRTDNPYPNFRWALYYEIEGTTNPSTQDLVKDLLYIKEQYGGQTAYLRIDNKPVIFVHGGPQDGTKMVERWMKARAVTGFYVMLKTVNGYANFVNQPDGWYDYTATKRTDEVEKHAFSVSPGFWKEGEAARLPRNLTEFKAAVTQMTRTNVPWKIVTTWNEWGEGSAVEPGDQVIQAKAKETTKFDPKGAPFKNAYIDVLKQVLPPLEKSK